MQVQHLQVPNCPGDGVFSLQSKGVGASFVLVTAFGFPRIGIEQEEQKNNVSCLLEIFFLLCARVSFWNLSRFRKVGGNCGQSFFCAFTEVC